MTKKLLDPQLSLGILIGLLGGIFGSLWITSMYRAIDRISCLDVMTFFVGLIFLIIIIILLISSICSKKK